MTVGNYYRNSSSFLSSSQALILGPQFFENYCIYLNNYLTALKYYLIDTVEHLILGLFGYILLCAILYVCITKLGLFGFTRDMRNTKRILFVIAHPDDEVMFFGPTIYHYTFTKKNTMVFLLCLSSGKNYGMNKTRTKELYESCKLLGIKEENILIHNNTDLPDAMDVRWPLEVISKHILYIVEAFGITNIVTFDRNGISGHQNHCSIYYAVANLILDDQLPKTCGVFVLETVNLLRKYSLFLDIPISIIMSRFRYMDGCKQRMLIHKAMHRHKSQLVWFRKLYILFSRYTLINTLQQLNLVDIELDYLELDE